MLELRKCAGFFDWWHEFALIALTWNQLKKSVDQIDLEMAPNTKP